MQSRSRTVRLVSAGALALAVSTISACSIAMPTDKVYTQAAGANDRSSRVDVLNAVIVATESGSGTLVTSLVNNENDRVEGGEITEVTDQLTDVRGVGDTAEIRATAFEPVEIPANDIVVLADGEGIELSGAAIKQGRFIELELTFAEAEPVRIQVPVVPNSGAFEGQDGPAPSESPSEEAESH